MPTGKSLGTAHDHTTVIDRIAAWSDHPSAFIACNDDFEHYVADDIPGIVPYRRRGRTVLVFGGVFAPRQHRSRLLSRLLREVVGRRKAVVAQLRPEDIELFAGHGFSVNQFGCSYSIDLSAFTSKGKPLAKVRQNISRAKREGTIVEEITDDRHAGELDTIDRQWLRAKGWHVKQLDFMVGQRGGRGRDERRLFIAQREGRITGYVSYSPAYGSRPGWLYDLTRRVPESSVGTIELINFTALQTFRTEGAHWLHLGFTPFAGIDDTCNVHASRFVRSMIGVLAERGNVVYPARTQQAFKLKWAPQVIEPEYLAFSGGPRPSSIWQLLRITNSI